MKKYKTYLIAALLVNCSAFSQKYSKFHDDPSRRAEMARVLAARAVADKAAAKAWAKANGQPMRFERDGTKYALMAIRDGKPLYYKTFNHNAAISTAADRVRTTAPYNLDGAGIDIGVWDGGTVRATHQELTGRVTVRDTGSPWGTDDHATHVAGTCAAFGVQPNAKGMAPAVSIESYDWDNDFTEMAAAAASAPGQGTKLYLSNHSYGIDSTSYLSWYGQYDYLAGGVDQITYDAQYYLPFFAAGNERDLTEGLYIPAKGGYDTMASYALAKNAVTVGAVNDAVSGGTRSVANGTMTYFSNWGPVDDGRIKPDIVANGYDLYSTIASSDTAYAEYGWRGTSMSSPNACGSAALLVEYYKELFPPNGAMRASTLKGLIIHTADDRGRPGPDYEYGWGLMNTLEAANLLKDYAAGSSIRLTEDSLSSSQLSDSHVVVADGSGPLRITLCWTDPAGTGKTGTDDRTPDLVNDLDIKVTGPGGTYYPYKLSYANPTANATTGENNVDNVEQVYIAVPTAGSYTITVDFDGPLDGGLQHYSLLVSGNSSDTDGDGMSDTWELLYFGGATNGVATADLDGDGSDNYTEFEAGTLPNDSTSVFEISSYIMPPEGGPPFILNWSTEAGRLYTVEYSESLTTGFLPLADAIDLPYTRNSYTDNVERASSQIFYQIRVRHE